MSQDPLAKAYAVMDAVMEMNTKMDILSAALTILRKNPEIRDIFLKSLNEPFSPEGGAP